MGQRVEKYHSDGQLSALTSQLGNTTSNGVPGTPTSNGVPGTL
jgi:hypothetical protein